MNDFLQDWQRWTRAERVMAVLITTAFLIGVPIALAIDFYLTKPGLSNGLRDMF